MCALSRPQYCTCGGGRPPYANGGLDGEDWLVVGAQITSFQHLGDGRTTLFREFSQTCRVIASPQLFD
eukprot:scaffold308673_cov30-Tisochrysis_lutea.AAC.3